MIRREDSGVGYVAASLVAGVFFGGLGGGVAFPILPQIGPVLGISPLVVGTILSVNRFTRLLMNAPAGSALDRVGTRRPMVGGFALQGAAPFGYVLGLHPEWYPGSGAVAFLAARVLWGVGSAFLFVGVLLSTVVLYAGTYGIAIGPLSAIGVSGVVMAVSVVGASVTTVLVGRFTDRLSNRALVTLPALAVLGAGFALLALVPTLWAVLAAVALVGVGVGGTNPPLLAYLGDVSPAGDVGKLGGAYNVFGDVGSTLGPLVALPLVSGVGFRAGYLACAALVAGIAALVAGTLLGDAGSPSPAVEADD